MKKRITPIAIITIFVAMIMAQASISYSSQPVMVVKTDGINQEQQDTIPKQRKDTTKKKNKDWPTKDTTNKPRRDTFPRFK